MASYDSIDDLMSRVRQKPHPFHSYFVDDYADNTNPTMRKEFYIKMEGMYWTGNGWSKNKLAAAMYRNANTYNRACYFAVQSYYTGDE